MGDIIEYDFKNLNSNDGKFEKFLYTELKEKLPNRCKNFEYVEFWPKKSMNKRYKKFFNVYDEDNIIGIVFLHYEELALVLPLEGVLHVDNNSLTRLAIENIVHKYNLSFGEE